MEYTPVLQYCKSSKLARRFWILRACAFVKFGCARGIIAQLFDSFMFGRPNWR